LLLHWSAKETMYKALGLMGVDLKDNLFVERFLPLKMGAFDAHEYFSGKNIRFRIRYFVTNDYVLTMTY
jgi:hypothetical protein